MAQPGPLLATHWCLLQLRRAEDRAQVLTRDLQKAAAEAQAAEQKARIRPWVAGIAGFWAMGLLAPVLQGRLGSASAGVQAAPSADPCPTCLWQARRCEDAVQRLQDELVASQVAAKGSAQAQEQQLQDARREAQALQSEVPVLPARPPGREPLPCASTGGPVLAASSCPLPFAQPISFALAVACSGSCARTGAPSSLLSASPCLVPAVLARLRPQDLAAPSFPAMAEHGAPPVAQAAPASVAGKASCSPHHPP